MASPKTRRNTTIAASIFYFLSIPFLILVIIGNTYENNILNDIYFFKLDVSNIIPISVANAQLLNSVARSLGLHDFYQVGMWNFCEGYNDQYDSLATSVVDDLLLTIQSQGHHVLFRSRKFVLVQSSRGSCQRTPGRSSDRSTFPSRYRLDTPPNWVSNNVRLLPSRYLRQLRPHIHDVPRHPHPLVELGHVYPGRHRWRSGLRSSHHRNGHQHRS